MKEVEVFLNPYLIPCLPRHKTQSVNMIYYLPKRFIVQQSFLWQNQRIKLWINKTFGNNWNSILNTSLFTPFSREFRKFKMLLRGWVHIEWKYCFGWWLLISFIYFKHTTVKPLYAQIVPEMIHWSVYCTFKIPTVIQQHWNHINISSSWYMTYVIPECETLLKLVQFNSWVLSSVFTTTWTNIWLLPIS